MQKGLKRAMRKKKSTSHEGEHVNLESRIIHKTANVCHNTSCATSIYTYINASIFIKELDSYNREKPPTKKVNHLLLCCYK